MFFNSVVPNCIKSSMELWILQEMDWLKHTNKIIYVKSKSFRINGFCYANLKMLKIHVISDML